jgi:mRNA interferase MazF
MKTTRPAVVVQNDVGNRKSRKTIVAPVTGTYRDCPFEIFLEADGSPPENDSSGRLDQIRTVSIADRIHTLSFGRLDGATMAVSMKH